MSAYESNPGLQPFLSSSSLNLYCSQLRSLLATEILHTFSSLDQIVHILLNSLDSGDVFINRIAYFSVNPSDVITMLFTNIYPFILSVIRARKLQRIPINQRDDPPPLLLALRLPVLPCLGANTSPARPA